VSIADFRARLPPALTLDNEGVFAVASDYFLVTVIARQGRRDRRHARC
jgi:hypothetical protein